MTNLSPCYKRIAIDGTQSTGKTTLFNDLSQTRDLSIMFSFIAESARIIAPSIGVKSSADWAELLSSRERHLRFLQTLFRYQRSREFQEKPFVVDGSLYKILAYARAFGFRFADVRGRLEVGNYDLIIFCHTEFDYAPDGFRYSEKRDLVQQILLGMHTDYHTGEVIHVTGGRAERYGQVLEKVRDTLGNFGQCEE